MPQNEINNSLSVLNNKGEPQNSGWSRSPVFFYDPVLIYAPRHRISEYDRYIVYSPTHMVTFEIRDDGWYGCMAVSVISLRDKSRSTQSFNTWFPLGSYEMPPSSTTGSVRWRDKKTHLDFINMDKGVKIIKADIPKFGRRRSFRGALVLIEPAAAQSLVTNQHWRNERNAFRYARCTPNYYVEGVIQFGSSEIVFTRGNGWGILDWNRCARPKEDIRYWAAACGMIEGKLLSFCAGYSLSDSSQGTENGFFVDGVLHKLDQVTFHIPMSNWLSSWRFTSNDSRLEMTFYPHQERLDRKALFFFNSTRRQVCGFFSGKVMLDDGSVKEFQNLAGFVERSRTRF